MVWTTQPLEWNSKVLAHVWMSDKHSLLWYISILIGNKLGKKHILLSGYKLETQIKWFVYEV